jgi:hypothetical protein
MEEAFLRRLFPETIPSATTGNSPVDVILGLRKDMAEFQKVSSKEAFKEEAFKETLRATMKVACMGALQRSAVGAAGDGRDADRYPNIKPIVDYLTERGVIRPKLSRARIRRLAKSVLAEKTAKGSGS